MYNDFLSRYYEIVTEKFKDITKKQAPTIKESSGPSGKEYKKARDEEWGAIESGIKEKLPYGLSVPFSHDALLEWARLLFDHDMTVPITKGEWEEFLWNTMELALNKGKSIF